MAEAEEDIRHLLHEVRDFLDRVARGQEHLSDKLGRVEERVRTIEQEQKQSLRDLIEMRAESKGALEAAKGADQGAQRSAAAAESAQSSIRWAIGLAATTLASVLLGGLLIYQNLGRLETRVETLTERVEHMEPPAQGRSAPTQPDQGTGARPE